VGAWYAASSGSLDMLQLLNQPDHKLKDDGKMLMRIAAASGYLDMCKYLREEGCAWDTTVCACAVSGSHLDTLRWLHEKWLSLGLQAPVTRCCATRFNRDPDILAAAVRERRVNCCTADRDAELCR
jgi:hypothetical protein